MEQWNKSETTALAMAEFHVFFRRAFGDHGYSPADFTALYQPFTAYIEDTIDLDQLGTEAERLGFKEEHLRLALPVWQMSKLDKKRLALEIAFASDAFDKWGVDPLIYQDFDTPWYCTPGALPGVTIPERFQNKES